MGKTKYGHETIELKSASRTREELEEHDCVRYHRPEYEQQIQRMIKLGINQGQTFEQMVNTLLYMVEKTNVGNDGIHKIKN